MAPQIPVRAREIAGREAASGLEDADAVTLLRQAERSNASAEAAADDEDVEVHDSRLLWRSMRGALPLLLLALVLVSSAAGATVRGTKKADLIAVALGSSRDIVHCGAGADVVSADRGDRVASDCEIVSRRLSVDPYRNGD